MPIEFEYTEQIRDWLTVKISLKTDKVSYSRGEFGPKHWKLVLNST